MFETLSPLERRKVLFASRIRHSPEFDVPRTRAVEAMVQNALYMAQPDEWFSADYIMQVLDEIGGLKTVRITEVTDCLLQLEKADKVSRRNASSWEFQLTKADRSRILEEFETTSKTVDRILISLFRNYSNGRNPKSLLPFFVEVVCNVFSLLGIQWASYVTGKPLNTLVDSDTIDSIVEKQLKKHQVPASIASEVKRRTIHFFQHSDPDYNQFKFNIGQSVYISELIGMDGVDLLSQEVFRGGILFVDSSVIIPALLSESRHHRVFHELRKICQRLEITLKITRLTVDEVRNVAAEQFRIAPLLYDSVPSGLQSQTRGDFFQTYLALRENGTENPIEKVFAPFENLGDTLGSLGIEIVDDAAYQSLADSPEVTEAKDIIQNTSVELRKKPKFENALTHDAIVFHYLQGIGEHDDKLWFVTRDLCLPSSWSKLQPNGIVVRCFLLDGLLQSISPFLVASDHLGDYSELFSQAVAAQLLPQGRLFDVEDFKVFKDLDIDCSEMDDHTVQEGLSRVKHYVLKGAAYRRKNLDDAAYELRRFFVVRRDNAEKWTEDRKKLEHTVSQLEDAISLQNERHQRELEEVKQQHEKDISSLQEAHSAETKVLSGRLSNIEASTNADLLRRTHRANTIKQVAASLIFLVVFYLIAQFLLVTEGVGVKGIFADGFYLLFGFVIWLVMIKALLFRRSNLGELFPTWREIKELVM